MNDGGREDPECEVTHHSVPCSEDAVKTAMDVLERIFRITGFRKSMRLRIARGEHLSEQYLLVTVSSLCGQFYAQGFLSKNEMACAISLLTHVSGKQFSMLMNFVIYSDPQG